MWISTIKSERVEMYDLHNEERRPENLTLKGHIDGRTCREKRWPTYLKSLMAERGQRVLTKRQTLFRATRKGKLWKATVTRKALVYERRIFLLLLLSIFTFINALHISCIFDVVIFHRIILSLFLKKELVIMSTSIVCHNKETAICHWNICLSYYFFLGWANFRCMFIVFLGTRPYDVSHI